MSRDLDKPVLRDVEAELDAGFPADLPDAMGEELTDDIFDLLWPVGEPDLPRHVLLARLVVRAFDLGRGYERRRGEGPPTVKTDADQARELFTAVNTLLLGTPAEGPLPPNLFNVTCHRDGVTFYRKHEQGLNRSDAINLAVWLIALADPTLSNAVPLLLRVATR